MVETHGGWRSSALVAHSRILQPWPDASTDLHRAADSARAPRAEVQHESMLLAAGAVHVPAFDVVCFMAELAALLQGNRCHASFDAIGRGRLASPIPDGHGSRREFARPAVCMVRAAVSQQVTSTDRLTRPDPSDPYYGTAWGIGGVAATPFLQKVRRAAFRQLRVQVAARLTTTFASSCTAQVSLPGRALPRSARLLQPAGDRSRIQSSSRCRRLPLL